MGIETKICGWCNIEKPISEYRLRKKNGIINTRRECKVCSRSVQKKRYLANKEVVLNRNKKYIQSRAAYKKKYDKEREQRIRTVRNKQRLAEYYRKKDTDINFRLKRGMRARMYFALVKGQKCESTMNLIGCSVAFLRQYLEGMFLDGMGWNNYGRNGWHVDHIIPCDSFDLSIPENQMKCFHYTNLQPLWEVDNLLKSNKLGYCSQYKNG